MQQLQYLKSLINKWKLNRPLIAAKMNMPVTTFKNKLDDKQPKYHFSESEIERLSKILTELAKDITRDRCRK